MQGLNDSELVTPRHHAVQFYANDASLFATVGEFLADGLVAGQPAVLIVSAAHREGILLELSRRNIDLMSARRNGNLVVLEADELLPMLAPNGEPESNLFDSHVGALIEQSLRGRGNTIVRVYGELVDLLWKSGAVEAAVKLEVLWNRLADRHRFALLCGYAMGQFYKEPRHLEVIRAQHTHVIRDTDAVRA